MAFLTDGLSTTAGVGGGPHVLSVTRNGELCQESVVDLGTALVTVVLRSSGHPLPPELVGSLVSSSTVAQVRLEKGDEIRVELAWYAEVRGVCEQSGDYRVVVRRSRNEDVVTAEGLHETLDVQLVADHEQPAGEPEHSLRGFMVRGDPLGFVLAHPQMWARVRQQTRASPMEFLTTMEEADSFLDAGWLVPFLGLKTLWQHRVLFVGKHGHPTALPLGTRVLGPWVARLAPAESYLVLAGEFLSHMREPTTRAEIALDGGGTYALDVYVSGGELATFVFTPESTVDDEDEPVQSIVRDVHDLWSEVPQEPCVQVPADIRW